MTDFVAAGEIPTELVTSAADTRTVLVNRVSWGAIIAGAVIALIIQFLLTLLGVGIGAATLHPATGNTPDASTFSLASVIWYAVTGIIAAFAGGFIASRLSGRPLASTGGLQGLTSWAVTTLFLLYLLTTAIGGLVGGALSGITSVAAGLGSSVGAVAQTAAPMLANSPDPFGAIQNQITQATGGTDPKVLQTAAVDAVRAAVTGDQSQAAQAADAAAQALAKSQNVSIDQARTEVANFQQQYQAALKTAQQKAVQAADAAASGTSKGAIAAFVVLLLGAIAAWVGGRVGTANSLATARALLRINRRSA